MADRNKQRPMVDPTDIPQGWQDPLTKWVFEQVQNGVDWVEREWEKIKPKPRPAGQDDTTEPPAGIDWNNVHADLRDKIVEKAKADGVDTGAVTDMELRNPEQKKQYMPGMEVAAATGTPYGSASPSGYASAVETDAPDQSMFGDVPDPPASTSAPREREVTYTTAGQMNDAGTSAAGLQPLTKELARLRGKPIEYADTGVLIDKDGKLYSADGKPLSGGKPPRRKAASGSLLD